MTFLSDLDNIGDSISNLQTNMREDLKELIKAEDYLNEILKACETATHVSGDAHLKRRLVNHYNLITAHMRDLGKYIVEGGEELDNIGDILPAVRQHIRDGFLEFDEYEDTEE